MAYLKVIWCCILIGWMVGRIISCHGILVTSIGLCVIHFGKNLAPNWKRWLCNAVSTILLMVGARPLTLIWNKKINLETIWIKTRPVLYFIWPLDIRNMSDSFQINWISFSFQTWASSFVSEFVLTFQIRKKCYSKSNSPFFQRVQQLFITVGQNKIPFHFWRPEFF